eukprot:Hpha_TRINITY_DN22964_c0_g1::TRINITY_DN22964_c0_g1_i1::g.154013::m.154013
MTSESKDVGVNESKDEEGVKDEGNTGGNGGGEDEGNPGGGGEGEEMLRRPTPPIETPAVQDLEPPGGLEESQAPTLPRMFLTSGDYLDSSSSKRRSVRNTLEPELRNIAGVSLGIAAVIAISLGDVGHWGPSAGVAIYSTVLLLAAVGVAAAPLQPPTADVWVRRCVDLSAAGLVILPVVDVASGGGCTGARVGTQLAPEFAVAAQAALGFVIRRGLEQWKPVVVVVIEGLIAPVVVAAGCDRGGQLFLSSVLPALFAAAGLGVYAVGTATATNTAFTKPHRPLPSPIQQPRSHHCSANSLQNGVASHYLAEPPTPTVKAVLPPLPLGPPPGARLSAMRSRSVISAPNPPTPPSPPSLQYSPVSMPFPTTSPVTSPEPSGNSRSRQNHSPRHMPAMPPSPMPNLPDTGSQRLSVPRKCTVPQSPQANPNMATPSVQYASPGNQHSDWGSVPRASSFASMSMNEAAKPVNEKGIKLEAIGFASGPKPAEVERERRSSMGGGRRPSLADTKHGSVRSLRTAGSQPGSCKNLRDSRHDSLLNLPPITSKGNLTPKRIDSVSQGEFVLLRRTSSERLRAKKQGGALARALRNNNKVSSASFNALPLTPVVVHATVSPPDTPGGAGAAGPVLANAPAPPKSDLWFGQHLNSNSYLTAQPSTNLLNVDLPSQSSSTRPRGLSAADFARQNQGSMAAMLKGAFQPQVSGLSSHSVSRGTNEQRQSTTNSCSASPPVGLIKIDSEVLANTQATRSSIAALETKLTEGALKRLKGTPSQLVNDIAHATQEAQLAIAQDMNLTSPKSMQKHIGMDQLAALWDRMDQDRVGVLDLDSCEEVLRTFGVVMSDDDLEDFFEDIDANGDGQIDFEEFARTFQAFRNDERFAHVASAIHVAAAVAAAEGTLVQAKAIETWNRFDNDRNGVLDVAELTLLCRELGLPSSDEEVAELVKELDEDGDGDIDFAEFMALFKVPGVDDEDEGPTVDPVMREAENVFLSLEGKEYYTSEQAEKEARLARKDKVEAILIHLMFLHALTNFIMPLYCVCFQTAASLLVRVLLLGTDLILVLWMWCKATLPADARGGRIVFDKKEIRKLYFSSTAFMVDIAVAVPFDFVGLFVHLDGIIMHPMFRLNKTLHVLHLEDLFHLFVRRYISSPTVHRIGSALYWWLLISHLFACMFAIVARREGDEQTFVMLGTVQKYSELPAWDKYTQAFDWALKTMSGLSRGLFPPADSETLLAIATVVSGVAVYALILATISAALTMPSSASRFREKVDNVQSFLRYQRLPIEFRAEVISFYKHTFKTVGGVDESEILDDLPLQLDLRVTYEIGTRIVGKVPLFADVVLENNLLLVSLAVRLVPEVQPPGALLTVKGELGDCMYFITSGECAIIGENGEEVFVLKTGDFFGEIALLHNVRRTATVRCRCFCNLLTLGRDSFNEVTEAFPEALDSIRSAAKGRIMQLVEQERSERRKSRGGRKRKRSMTSVGSPKSSPRSPRSQSVASRPGSPFNVRPLKDTRRESQESSPLSNDGGRLSTGLTRLGSMPEVPGGSGEDIFTRWIQDNQAPEEETSSPERSRRGRQSLKGGSSPRRRTLAGGATTDLLAPNPTSPRRNTSGVQQQRRHSEHGPRSRRKSEGSPEQRRRSRRSWQGGELEGGGVRVRISTEVDGELLGQTVERHGEPLDQTVERHSDVQSEGTMSRSPSPARSPVPSPQVPPVEIELPPVASLSPLPPEPVAPLVALLGSRQTPIPTPIRRSEDSTGQLPPPPPPEFPPHAPAPP